MESISGYMGQYNKRYQGRLFIAEIYSLNFCINFMENEIGSLKQAILDYYMVKSIYEFQLLIN